MDIEKDIIGETGFEDLLQGGAGRGMGRGREGHGEGQGRGREGREGERNHETAGWINS